MWGLVLFTTNGERVSRIIKFDDKQRAFAYIKARQPYRWE